MEGSDLRLLQLQKLTLKFSLVISNFFLTKSLISVRHYVIVKEMVTYDARISRVP